MGKKRNKGKQGKPDGDYVTGLPLFYSVNELPTQKLYSDIAYSFEPDKMLKAYKQGSTSGIKGPFFEPFKGSPYGFTRRLPFSKLVEAKRKTTEYDSFNIQEFEFSKNTLVRTMYTEDGDGINPLGEGLSLWFATRDVLTGNFEIKKGKISGTAYSLTRQLIDDGLPSSITKRAHTVGGPIIEEPHYQSQDIKQWSVSEGVPMSSFGNNGLSGLFPQKLAPWTDDKLTIITDNTASAGGVAINKLFPDGWHLNPFGNDLV